MKLTVYRNGNPRATFVTTIALRTLKRQSPPLSATAIRLPIMTVPEPSSRLGCMFFCSHEMCNNSFRLSQHL